MLKRILVLFLATLGGGLLGILLTVLLLRGWFSPWNAVATPPEKPTRLLALDGIQLWIKDSAGTIYRNPNSLDCIADCWSIVDAVQLPANQPAPEGGRLSESCLPPPPLTRLQQKIGQCDIGFWQDVNTVYALRTDGSIRVWRFTSGGEWGAVMVIMAAIVGASIFFGIALTVILLKAIVDAARKQPNR